MAPEKTDEILDKLDKVLDTPWAQHLIHDYEEHHPEKVKDPSAA